MNCSFCGKGFTKGEHLRRHERSHRGEKPFRCKTCQRSFTRQDSLARHEKTHAQQRTPLRSALPSPATGSEIADASLSTVPEDGTGQPNSWSQFDAGANVGVIDGPFSEMDLDLIWPDSEDLFQSILSADFNQSWQLPPGTLPLPVTGLNTASAITVTGGNTNGNVGRDTSLNAGDKQGAITGVSQMVSAFSSSVTRAVDSTSLTSVFLDECLHMFFDRFIPTFPVMHRATFVFKDCSHPLLLNAIAIGSLYLGPSDSVRKGEALWHLAHTAVATSWQSLIAHRGPYDACAGVQLVLSALLSVIYGALSHSATIRGASQALHASAFFWARQCGIFESEPYDLQQLPSLGDSMEEKSRQWKLWVAREIQQRALLSHYVLDGLIAHMQGNSTSVRHTSNTLKLPSSEPAFQDDSVDRWLSRMHDIQQERTSFRDIYGQLFAEHDNLWALTQGCSTFSLRVLLEGLQSMIADSDPKDGAIINPPSRSQISNALSWIYEKIATCPDNADVERLEILLRWHAVCLEAVAKTPQLCNYICKRWGVKQTLWPNNNLREQEYDLPKLVDSPDGRKALLHATAIQDIVEKLPRGRAHVVHMPSSLFAAATIYGVHSFAGRSNVRILRHVEWKDVVLTAHELQTRQTETVAFICNRTSHASSPSTSPKNLLYEFNNVQKLLSCLATQWGVSSDMERIVAQWNVLCH